MNKFNLTGCVVAFALLGGTSVLANGFVVGGSMGGGSVDDSGIKLNLYETTQTSRDLDLTLRSKVQPENTFAYKLHAGYDFNITPRISIGPEISYQTWLVNSTATGKIKVTPDSLPQPILPGGAGRSFSANINLQSLNFLAMLKYNVSKAFNVFVGGGMSYATGDIGVSEVNIEKAIISGNNMSVGSIKMHQWVPVLNIGFGYKLNQHVEITLEYDHLYGDETLLSGEGHDTGNNGGSLAINANIPSASSYMLGMNYIF